MILAECKQFVGFSVMSKSTMDKWCKKPGIYCKRHNKKMQVYQHFDVDIVPPVCKFIRKETPAQMLTCKFFKFFQPAQECSCKI